MQMVPMNDDRDEDENDGLTKRDGHFSSPPHSSSESN